MSIEGEMDPVERAREQVRESRAEVLRALHSIPPQHTTSSRDPFPRSAILRALLGHDGRRVLGGAAVTLAMLRPGLFSMALRVARLLPLLPVFSSLLNRYLVRRNAVPE